MIENIVGWLLMKVGGLLWAIFACVLLFPLGITGLFLRDGLTSGNFGRVLLVLGGWLGVYLPLFRWLSWEHFWPTLFLLLVPVLGFFKCVVAPKNPFE